jgi:hypothetical protein
MARFRSEPSGRLCIRLNALEVAILGGIVDEVIDLIEAGDGADPVTKRLFPDAYESQEDARAFKEMVEDELKSTKLRTLRLVGDCVHDGRKVEVHLGPEEAHAWLTALTDMRLALGARVGATEEKMAARHSPTDPDARDMASIHWLARLQDSMLRAVSV